MKSIERIVLPNCNIGVECDQAALLVHLQSYSPYLYGLTRRFPEWWECLFDNNLQAHWDILLADLHRLNLAELPEAAFMRELRIAKHKAALLIATADLRGVWTLSHVTNALSILAEICLQLATDYLLYRAQEKGEIALGSATSPSVESGLIILAMGKLGGWELNYSSDIDLILLYDKARVPYIGNRNVQDWCNKFAQALVRLMQERTAEGYVFRMDLRLRPDPGSTPPMMSTQAAFTYYETVGQNWERAALIKARAIAGDIASGERFLKELTPFIWRKHLDFAAIEDIQSIKRQMNNQAGAHIELLSHNLKTGVGGIREIEFFTQIHQLIWGGRNATLRARSTCEVLDLLVESHLVPAETRDTLVQAYRFLRTVEHRLQMREDEQTHSLPPENSGMDKLAAFCALPSASLTEALLSTLHTVHHIYADSFKGNRELGAGGNLVFTGVDPDPETLKTISNLGFQKPIFVCEAIMNWHRGNRRATRNKRARELITEITPALLKALGNTADPDGAFRRFDDFVGQLPAGVQLFSLFFQHPELLDVIATVMGNAPSLADHISRYPHLLDTALAADFLKRLTSPAMLKTQCQAMLEHSRSYEEKLRILRSYKNEKIFHAGVHLLQGINDVPAIHMFLSHLADTLLTLTLDEVTQEFARAHGHIPQGEYAVLGLGRLGAYELTFGSDIDLIFIYRAREDAESDGEKPLLSSVYYNRLSQRVITALTAMMAEGKLYEVDTRLRPSGGDGMLAVSLEGFEKYFHESAWTFEHMALCKARIIAGDQALSADIAQVVERILHTPREADTIRHDIRELRPKIAAQWKDTVPWDVKYARGGMLDLDFLAQFFVLSRAPEVAFGGSAAEVLGRIANPNSLPTLPIAALQQAHLLQNRLLAYLRLCVDGKFTPERAPKGLLSLLCVAFNVSSIEALHEVLVKSQATVYAACQHYLYHDVS